MLKNLDEIRKLKEILENGFSTDWKNEIRILTKHLKLQGIKKCKIKEQIKEKLEKEVEEYNKFTMFNTVNNIIDKAWKDDKPLRQITQITIPKATVDWFLALEGKKIPKETIDAIKAKKATKVIEKFWNWNRVKMLWTLYVWAKIQQQYSDFWQHVAVEREVGYFRECAGLPERYKVVQESNNLHDLGIVRISSERKLELLFLEQLPYDGDMVTLTGQDMVKCGYWLEKQKKGSYICQKCGKEIAVTNSIGRKRKYCPKCTEKKGTIQAICIDCGKVFDKPAKATKTCRCFNCQEIRDKELKRASKAKTN